MRRSLTRLACHGHCRCTPERQAHHNRLLQVETDPDALVDLFETAVTWAELEYSPEATIPPHEWLDFAERHRWHDPDRMQRIFGLATDIALRAVSAPVAPTAALGNELGMAAGSGICPTLAPPPGRHLRLAAGPA